jgi:hypothetical protein
VTARDVFSLAAVGLVVLIAVIAIVVELALLIAVF